MDEQNEAMEMLNAAKSDYDIALEKIAELEASNMSLKFELEMAYDMARMGAATEIFASLVAHKPLTKEIKPVMAEHAMKSADTLISHYQDMMEGKRAAYMKSITATAAAGENGESVQ